MILGRSEILEKVAEGKIIEEFEEACLESAGYDLRAGAFFRIEGNTKIGKDERTLPSIDEVDLDTILLEPDDYILVRTIEKVNMPHDVAARVLNRSSIFRSGCSVLTAFVDPGFQGQLTFGLRNLSKHSFTVEKGARLAQIVFEEVRGDTVPYTGRYQGGNVV